MRACTILVHLFIRLIQGIGWILIPWSAHTTSIYFSILELISMVDSSKYKVLYPLLLEVKATYSFICFFFKLLSLTFSSWIIHSRNISPMVASSYFSFLLLLHCSEDAKRLRMFVLIRFSHTEQYCLLIKIPDSSEA